MQRNNKKEFFQVTKKSTEQDTIEEEKKNGRWKRKDLQEKTKAGKNVSKCELCDYTCQKFTVLSKHNNTQHIGHACKDCGKNLNNSMDLLQHVAIEHTEEDAILNDIKHINKERADTDVDRNKG